MRIGINLATRPFANLGPILKQLRISMGALALVAIALGLGFYAIHQKAKDARIREHSLDGQIARVNSERQGYQAMMRQPQNAAVLGESESLNQLFDEKAFSWTLAMEDLETVLPSGVQVTTLEPTRDKDGHITLRLRVLGPRDRAIELMKNLEHSRRFLRPRIVGESSESESRPGQPVAPVSESNRENFDLLADYNPAPPGERRTVKLQAVKDDPQTSQKNSTPPSPDAHRLPNAGVPRPKAPHQPHIGVPQ
jgi:type IV pilus assembly protein PilN